MAAHVTRSGTIASAVDPFDHEWPLAAQTEDPSPEKLGRRAAAAMG